MDQAPSKECSCYWPEKILVRPNSPALIDPETNEFRWYNQNDNSQSYLVFKFCPKCGFEMPKHEREFVEKGISKAEYLRLEKMVEGIENIDQVRQKLGKPTFERRSIAYTGLSETAKVSISIGSKEIQISKTVHLGTASYVRGQEVPDWEIDVSILPKEVKE